MELRDLRTFVTVVELGSFTAAARVLGYTQSAVSQQVAALEHELGRPLLERHPVRPMPAGARLAEHAERILLRHDLARSEIAALDVEPAAVRAVVGPLTPPDVLAAGTRAFRDDHPAVRVDVVVLRPADAIAELARGEADVAVIDGITPPDYPLPQVDPGLLVTLALREVPLAVVFPKGHPLGRRRHLDLDTLGDAPWIEAPLLAGPPLVAGGPLLGSPAAWTPAQPGRLRYDGADVATLLAMVAAGVGLAILPEPACCHMAATTSVLVAAPALVHRCEVVTRRRPTVRAEQLALALRSAAT